MENSNIYLPDGEQRTICKVHMEKLMALVKSSSDESMSENVEDLSSSYSDWAKHHHHADNNSILERTGAISPTKFDNHIAEIKDEQERVQKKTFVNWINSHLSKKDANLKINDVTTDLRDGTKLLALLEILSGEKLVTEKGFKLRRPHFLSNVNTAIQFLQSKKIKLVNINSTDFVDGKPTVVLGLIWTIILYFQIEEGTREFSSLDSHLDTSVSNIHSFESSTTVRNIKVENPKKTLLKWVNSVLPRNCTSVVQDFGLAWRDGILLFHLINALGSNLVDVSSLKTITNRQRLEIGFTAAEQYLGIHRLLDPEDVDVDRPDERSIMTYIAQFAYKYLRLGAYSEESSSDMCEPYQKLIRWLNDRTRDSVFLQRNPDSYSDYVIISRERETHSSLMQQLRTSITSEGVYKNIESSSNIEKLWLLLETQLSTWHWMLDNGLLSPLDKIANWFFAAENMISNDDLTYTINEDAPFVIGRKLDEYKTFFEKLPNIKSKIEEVSLTVSKYHKLPECEVDYTFTRLREIVEKSQRHERQLKFLYHKYCLFAFLNLTERKLKKWTVKYGNKEKVQQLLDEFNDYTVKNNVIQEFNRAFTDMQNAATRLKREVDGANIDKALRDTANRWHAISMELFCTQNMLEEVVSTWEQWKYLAAEIESWIEKSYNKLNLPEEEKRIYFQDLKAWQDRYLMLEDTVSFLVTISEDLVGDELKREFTHISNKWKEISDKLDEHIFADIELQNRKRYYFLSEQFQKWVVKAEFVLNAIRQMNDEEIRNNIRELQNLQSETDQNEEVLKSVSKLIQSLIQNLTKEEVDEMMTSLERDKESILRIRRLILLRIDFYEKLLIQYESLEEGQKAVIQWLTQAENLLCSFSLEGGILHLQHSLENHKIFFARLPYWESILRSKNNLFQEILRFVDAEKKIKTDKYGKMILDLNSRFERIICQVEEQEKAFEEAICRWHNYQEIEHIIQDWLQNARNLFTEIENITQCSFETEKKFFDSAINSKVEELQETAIELSRFIPADEYEQVQRHVETLLLSWKEIYSKVPLHMVQKEFSWHLTSFNYTIDEIKKELNTEQKLFSQGVDIEDLVKRHEDYFSNTSGCMIQGKELLNKLEHVCTLYTTLEEKSDEEYYAMKKTHENAEQNWKITLQDIDFVRSRLLLMVEKWIAYRKNIDEIKEWIDNVEESMRTVLQKVSMTEEIEEEKSFLLKMRCDVDKKIEDLHCLIYTFDSFSQFDSESSRNEQEKLQNLMKRCKSLLPTIEVAITWTEFFSKYYTYRKQIVEVSLSLKKTQKEVKTQPLSIESIDKQINQHQKTIDFLDKHHFNVMNIIQEGEELSMEIDKIPEFFGKMPITLESEWNDVYLKANGTLKTLKEAQIMLNSYQHHKESILFILDRFETIFHKVSQKYSNLSQVESELKEKTILKEEVRNLLDSNVLSLKDISRRSSLRVASMHQELQVQEIEFLETKLKSCQTDVENNIELLTNVRTSWSNLEYSIEQMQTWITTVAFFCTNTIDIDTPTVEEKIKIYQQLKNEYGLITSLLEKAYANLEFLIEYIEEPQKTDEKLKSLHSSINDMEQQVLNHEIQFQRQFTIFEECKKEMKKLISWIEGVAAEFEMIIATSCSMMDIDNQLEKLKKESEKWEKKLHSLSQIEKENRFYLDSISYVSQLQKIQSKIDSTIEQLQQFRENWTKLEKGKDNIKIRLEQLSWSPVAKTLPEKNIDLPTLRNQLSIFKNVIQDSVELDNECTKLESNFSVLFSDFSDQIIKEKKSDFDSLRKECKNVISSAGENINLILKTITLREVFEQETEKFTTWLFDTDFVVSNLVEINRNNLDEELRRINLLITDFEDRQCLLKDIQKNIVSEVDEEVNSEPMSMFDRYKNLEKIYLDLKTKLFDKKIALEGVKALDNWYLETRKRILKIKYLLEADQFPKNIMNDLAKIRSKIDSHRRDFEKIQSSCQIGKINAAFLDDMRIFIDEMELEIDNFKALVTNEIEKEKTSQAHKEDFSILKERFLIALMDCKKYIHLLTIDSKNVDSPCSSAENTMNLEEKLCYVNSIKEDLRQKMNILSDSDLHVTEIQDIESSMYEWDVLQEQINQRKKTFLTNSENNQIKATVMSREVEETLTETKEYNSNLVESDMFPELEKNTDIQFTEKELQKELSVNGDTLQNTIISDEITSIAYEGNDSKKLAEDIVLPQEELTEQIQTTIYGEPSSETSNSKSLEFEDYKSEIEIWLKNSESLTSSFHTLKTSLQEKKNALEQFQVHLEIIFNRQNDIDELTVKAQELFSECSDAKVLNRVTLISTKYNTLLSVAKKTMRKLELHYQEHQQLNSLCQEGLDIVFRTKEKITECKELPTTNAEINNKMQMLKTIQHMFKQAHKRLKYAVELKQKVSLNTEPNGVSKVIEDADFLQQEFETLSIEVLELQQRLCTRVTYLEETNKVRVSLENWLNEIEPSITREQENELGNDLSNKRVAYEKFKLILADITLHSNAVENLKNSLQSNNSCLSTELESIFSRYRNILGRVAETTDKLNRQIMCFEEYKDAYEKTQNWLKNTRNALQHLVDSRGSKSQILENINQLSHFWKNLPEGIQLMENAKAVSANVIKSENDNDIENSELHIALLENEFADIQRILKEADAVFSECILAWNNFDVASGTFKNWEFEIRKKIVDINNRNLKSISSKNLSECLALKNEVMEWNEFIDELQNNGGTLMKLTAYTPVGDEIQAIQTTYNNLSVEVQNLQQNTETIISHHAEFVKVKTEFQEWLTNVRGILQDCIGNGDQLWIDERLQSVASVFDKKAKGDNLCRDMQQILANVLNNIPVSYHDSLITETSKLEQEWNVLKNELNSVKVNLESLSNRWNEFNNLIKDLKEWLSKIRNNIDVEFDTKADLAIMKMLRQQFSETNEILAKKSSQIEFVVQESNILAVWSPGSNIKETTLDIKSEWQRLVEVCSKKELFIESEIVDSTTYLQMLQDIEKWISETSIQLTAPTSLLIIDKHQIKELISQLNTSTQQIESYQTNINRFKQLANQQIMRYELSIPIIRKSIEQLLNGMQDNYDSFLRTALETTACLQNVLSQFQEYENSLQFVKFNLDELEKLAITRTANIPTNLDGCKILLKSVQDLYDAAQTEKIKFYRTVQIREAIVTKIVKPENYSFDISSSIAYDREIVMRIQLEDVCDQLQHQLSLQSNNIVQWEKFNNSKSEFIEWMKLQTTAISKWETESMKLRDEANCYKIQDINVNFVNKKKNLDQDKLLRDDEFMDRLNSFEKLVQNAVARQQKYNSDFVNFNNAVSTLNSHYNATLIDINSINDDKMNLSPEERVKIWNNINENFEAGSKIKVLSVMQNAEKIPEYIPDLDFKQIALQVRKEMAEIEGIHPHRITELETMTGFQEKIGILMEQKILLTAVLEQLTKWADIRGCDALFQELGNIKSNIKILNNFLAESNLNLTNFENFSLDIHTNSYGPETSCGYRLSQEPSDAASFPEEICINSSTGSEGKSVHYVTDSLSEITQIQTEEWLVENENKNQESSKKLSSEEKAMTGQPGFDSSIISNNNRYWSKNEENKEHLYELKKEHLDLNNTNFFLNHAVSDFELVQYENVDEEISFTENVEVFCEPLVKETEIIDPEQNSTGIRNELNWNMNICYDDFATMPAVSQESSASSSSGEPSDEGNQKDNEIEICSELQSEKNVFENDLPFVQDIDTLLPTEHLFSDNYFNFENLKTSITGFHSSLADVKLAVEDEGTRQLSGRFMHYVEKASKLFTDRRSQIIYVKAWYRTSAQEQTLVPNAIYTLVLQITDECIKPLLSVNTVPRLSSNDFGLFQHEENPDSVFITQVCNHELLKQTEKLSQLQDTISEISVHIKADEDSILVKEVAELIRKLENMKLKIHIYNTTDQDKKFQEPIEMTKQAENCIYTIKEDLQSVRMNTNQDHIEQIRKLETRLHSFIFIGNSIDHRQEKEEILLQKQYTVHGKQQDEIKLLKLWQQIFEEASQQFQELFSKIIDDQNNEEALNLWKEHLENIRKYLLTRVPDSFKNLTYDLQINLSHENLLVIIFPLIEKESFQNTIFKAKNTLKITADLHAKILIDIKNRRERVEKKLDAWQRYRQDHHHLLSWLRDVETKQSELNLQYVRLRTIDNVLKETENLMKEIPTGINLANELRNQQDDLLNDCSANICTLVRAELDMNYRQIQNLDAALRMWHEFLEKIKCVIELHKKQVDKIEKMIKGIHSGIEQTINCRLESSTWDDLHEKQNTIKELDNVLTLMDAEFNELIDLEEKLKETGDIRDLKTIKQKHWSLEKEQKELRYKLSIYALQCEEKLALWEHFNSRIVDFLTWCNKMNERAERFLLKTYSPKEIIQKFEIELCAEVRLKEEEYDWLLKTHAALCETELKNEIFKQESNMSNRIDNIKILWTQINNKTINKINKISKLLGNIEDLMNACEELNVWIHNTEADLENIIPFNYSEDADLKDKIEEYERIYKKIQEKDFEVSEILKRGEIFITDYKSFEIPVDVNSVVITRDQVKNRWISLQEMYAKSKESILSHWNSLNEIAHLCKACDFWLNERENKIDSWKERLLVSESFQIDLAEEIQSMSAEMNNSSTQFKQLENYYNDFLTKNYVRDLVIARKTLSRHKKLRITFQEFQSLVTNDLQNWEEFQSLHGQLILKLSQLDALLTQLQIKEEGAEKSGENLNVYNKKFKKLLRFESEHELLKKLVRHVESVKLKLTTGNKIVNINALQKMSDEYLSMHKKLKRRIQLLKKLYNKKLSRKSNMNEGIQVETLKFEKDFASQVDTLSDSFKKLNSFHSELHDSVREFHNNVETPTELHNFDNMDKLPQIIASCRSSIDFVKHLSVVMVSQQDKLGTNAVSNSVKELEAMFQQLLYRIYYQSYKQISMDDGEDYHLLRCPFCVQQSRSLLGESIKRLEDWIEDVDTKLQESTFSFPENTDQMENIIQNQKEFLVYLDNHGDLIVALNIIEEHLKEHEQGKEKMLEFRKRIILLNEKWKRVSSQSFIWHNKFEAIYFEDNRFRIVITKLLNKIENAEHSIARHTSADLLKKSIARQKYNELKNTYEELKECELRTTSLLAIHQVYNSQKITNLENSLNELNGIRLRLQSLIEVSWIYITKLEECLNRNSCSQLLCTNRFSCNPEIPSKKFLEDIVNKPADHVNFGKSNLSKDASYKHGFLTRVMRISFPIHIILLVALSTVLLFTNMEEEFSCTFGNTLAWSFEPVLRYPNGPPPT